MANSALAKNTQSPHDMRRSEHKATCTALLSGHKSLIDTAHLDHTGPSCQGSQVDILFRIPVWSQTKCSARSMCRSGHLHTTQSQHKVTCTGLLSGHKSLIDTAHLGHTGPSCQGSQVDILFRIPVWSQTKCSGRSMRRSGHLHTTQSQHKVTCTGLLSGHKSLIDTAHLGHTGPSCQGSRVDILFRIPVWSQTKCSARSMCRSGHLHTTQSQHKVTCTALLSGHKSLIDTAHLGHTGPSCQGSQVDILFRIPVWSQTKCSARSMRRSGHLHTTQSQHKVTCTGLLSGHKSLIDTAHLGHTGPSCQGSRVDTPYHIPVGSPTKCSVRSMRRTGHLHTTQSQHKVTCTGLLSGHRSLIDTAHLGHTGPSCQGSRVDTPYHIPVWSQTKCSARSMRRSGHLHTTQSQHKVTCTGLLSGHKSLIDTAHLGHTGPSCQGSRVDTPYHIPVGSPTKCSARSMRRTGHLHTTQSQHKATCTGLLSGHRSLIDTAHLGHTGPSCQGSRVDTPYHIPVWSQTKCSARSMRRSGHLHTAQSQHKVTCTGLLSGHKSLIDTAHLGHTGPSCQGSQVDILFRIPVWSQTKCSGRSMRRSGHLHTIQSQHKVTCTGLLSGHKSLIDTAHLGHTGPSCQGSQVDTPFHTPAGSPTKCSARWARTPRRCNSCGHHSTAVCRQSVPGDSSQRDTGCPVGRASCSADLARTRTRSWVEAVTAHSAGGRCTSRLPNKRRSRRMVPEETACPCRPSRWGRSSWSDTGSPSRRRTCLGDPGDTRGHTVVGEEIPRRTDQQDIECHRCTP